MEQLVKLIAEHPECFGDTVFLPCGLREFVDLLNEGYRPLVKQVTGSGMSRSAIPPTFPSSVQIPFRA